MRYVPLIHYKRPFALALSEYVAKVCEAVDEHNSVASPQLVFAHERSSDEERVERGALLERLTIRCREGVVPRPQIELVLELKGDERRSWIIDARLSWALRPFALITPSTRSIEETTDVMLELLGRIHDELLVRRIHEALTQPGEAARRVDTALATARQVPISNFRGQMSGGKVVGHIRCGDQAFRAPGSRRDCAYYELRLYEAEMVDGEWRWGNCVAEFKNRSGFFLEDPTGRVRVLPAGAQTSAKTDYVHECAWYDIPQRLWSLFEKHCSLSESYFRARRLHLGAHKVRIEEAVFEEGERVAAIGRGYSNLDPGTEVLFRGYRSPAEGQICLANGPGAPLMLSDNPETM